VDEPGATGYALSMSCAGVLGALTLVAATLTSTVPISGGNVAIPLPAAPAAPEGCREALRGDGFALVPWPLRPTKLQEGVVCEAPEGVSIRRGGSGLRFEPAARVNCAFGLRLARFEAMVQEEARHTLHSRVRAIVQLGTYNCRRMAAYPDLVSEHSFANAIDVATFVLANGRSVVVERDWVPASKAAARPASLFLRRLTRRLYDEKVFSVVLTPSYDSHHKNHLHLDGAEYSVDGT
jgi:hypothetical protein